MAKRVIDLKSPEGNAFAILGIAKGYAKKLGLDWKPIQEKAMSGDYENLLSVIKENFGSVITFKR